MVPRQHVFFLLLEKNSTNMAFHGKTVLSLSVDNSNTMIGKKNSVASRFLQKNYRIFTSGCPCHVAHITVSNFSEYIGSNVEDVLVDLFYWLDKIAKRKRKLKEHFEFCDQEYLGVLKHLSVRWLSLEKYVSRVI